MSGNFSVKVAGVVEWAVGHVCGVFCVFFHLVKIFLRNSGFEMTQVSASL